jgi:hypothetical protein
MPFTMGKADGDRGRTVAKAVSRAPIQESVSVDC